MPERTYSKNTRGVNREDQMVPYYPCCKIPVKWTEGLTLLSIHISVLNNSILVTNRHHGTDLKRAREMASRASILDSIQKITNPPGAECGDSLTSTSTAATSEKRLVTEPADRLEKGRKIRQMVQRATTRKCSLLRK